MNQEKAKIKAIEIKAPKHIGIILDGNRRYAKLNGLNPWEGHEYGAKKIKELFNWLKELDVKEVTLFTFSTENFKRPKTEVEYLFKLFKRFFKDFLKEKDKFSKNGLRIRFIGRKEMFPKDIQDIMKEIENETKDNKNYIANFAMGYGGHAEIVDAVKKIAKGLEEGKIRKEDINESTLSLNMYNDSFPEMIIRTSGEKRLSGFMLWASAYSELFFIDKMWPEFLKEDLITCIKEYNNRNKRFGK